MKASPTSSVESELSPLPPTDEELLFTEARDFVTSEIFRLYGIPEPSACNGVVTCGIMEDVDKREAEERLKQEALRGQEIRPRPMNDSEQRWLWRVLTAFGRWLARMEARK